MDKAEAIVQRRHIDGSSARPLLHPRFWAALIVLGDGSVKLDAADRTAGSGAVNGQSR